MKKLIKKMMLATAILFFYHSHDNANQMPFH